MDPKQLKNLDQLCAKDLAGWQITTCYFLELEHGLMGTFPALDEHEQVVLALDKDAFVQVVEQLPPRRAKLTSLKVLLHTASGFALSLENCNRGNFQPLLVRSTAAIEELCQRQAVHWAPGLISCR